MIHLRVSEELKDSLEREAKANGRSLNSEVVTRIESSFNISLLEPGKKEIDINKAHDLARAILAKMDEKNSPISDDELALIKFWRSLSIEKKQAVTELLHIGIPTIS